MPSGIIETAFSQLQVAKAVHQWAEIRVLAVTFANEAQSEEEKSAASLLRAVTDAASASTALTAVYDAFLKGTTGASGWRHR